MEKEQLQHLGKLLTSGEENALLAREIMIGQGIWDSATLCKILNDQGDLVTDFWGLFGISICTPFEVRFAPMFIECDDVVIGYHEEPWNNIAKFAFRNFRPRMIYQLETAVNRTPKMLPAHHNPTAPTTPTQISAFGPSGV